MDDDTRLDNALAAFTDALLAGETVQASEEWYDLAHVVRQLQQVIEPEASPDATYRSHLTQRLSREWNLKYDRRARRARLWHKRRGVQLTALAAGVALVLAILALLLSYQSPDSSASVQGTALGSVAWVIGIVGVILGIGLLVIWLRQRPKA